MVSCSYYTLAYSTPLSSQTTSLSPGSPPAQNAQAPSSSASTGDGHRRGYALSDHRICSQRLLARPHTAPVFFPPGALAGYSHAPFTGGTGTPVYPPLPYHSWEPQTRKYSLDCSRRGAADRLDVQHSRGSCKQGLYPWHHLGPLHGT